MAALRERSITGQVKIPVRLLHIAKLVSGQMRPIKGYELGSHSLLIHADRFEVSPEIVSTSIREAASSLPWREMALKQKANASGNLGSVGSGRHSRVRRLVQGWSANLVQLALGVTQQVLLVPVFLHFWSSDVLAAWLAIVAAGNLMLVADAGLQLHTINRFLIFKSSIDSDGRTASFYVRMRRIYFAVAGVLSVLLLVLAWLAPPAAVLGFQGVAQFDAALLVMTIGVLGLLPSNLVSALYRARGEYGRAVWFQNGAMLVAQLAQLVAILTLGTLIAVSVAFVSMQVAAALFLVAIDAPRLFPFLRRKQAPVSWRLFWRWTGGQFRLAFPFAVANLTELALLNAPVLLVSGFLVDRIAVAQWGLTRVVVGLLRGLCVQVSLPLAAELGHDYAIGDKERLRRLFARGSLLVTVLSSLIVSGLLPFWPDFFALWTRGSVPYDAALTATLLLGSAITAPSLLALSFANYSDRRDLLVRTKGLQLVVFLVLSVTLIPALGVLGAAIAIALSDLLIQMGVLGIIVIRQTLQNAFRHLLFSGVVAAAIILLGYGLGMIIRSWLPLAGSLHLVIGGLLWLLAMGLLAGVVCTRAVREALMRSIPD
ncbi:O-antigen/teichoic acid export membrane protein [Bradyrhizobium sp. GM2.4]